MNYAGRDAAFIGPNENQFVILDDDKTGLALYILPGVAPQEVDEKNGAVEQNPSADTNVNSVRGPLQYMFESEVDRIFSTPLGAWGTDQLYCYLRPEMTNADTVFCNCRVNNDFCFSRKSDWFGKARPWISPFIC